MSLLGTLQVAQRSSTADDLEQALQQLEQHAVQLLLLPLSINIISSNINAVHAPHWGVSCPTVAALPHCPAMTVPEEHPVLFRSRAVPKQRPHYLSCADLT